MKKYIYLFVCCNLFLSCEDYLDKAENTDGLQKDDVFTDIRLARNFLDGGYTRLLTEISARDQNTDILTAMIMSGEGYPGRFDKETPETYALYAQGDYLTLINKPENQQATPYFVNRYYDGYRGVRTMNEFIQNADLIANGTQEQIDRLLGQAYYLRAFFYHLMTKRHGGLVYFKENLDLNASLDRERQSYESNLTDMLADIDQAISLLPVEWDAANLGRPTKGAAMALKSRITLFAASPLVNTSNNQDAWALAAQSAAELINFANSNGLYQLVDASNAINMDVGHNGSDLFVPEPEELSPYRNIFVGPGVTKVIPQEVIYMEINDNFDLSGGIVNPVPSLSKTNGFNIIKGNTFPQAIGATANFVEKFETKNGLAIEDDPSYNSQEPFINRDPRFYNAILYDGVSWRYTVGALNNTGKVDLAVRNESGDFGLDLHDPNTPSNLLWRTLNVTGYKIRKWIPNGAYWQNGNRGNWDFHLNNNIFRMSEVYLNYAEAANEAYGPNGSAPGTSLTALQAVNIIRNRVGMPNVNSMYTGSKESLRARIRNERLIELCFEDISYDDIRRWKVAHLPEYRKVEFLEMRWQGGPTETFPTGFSFDNVEQPNLEKTFTEKHYWWPIPNAELEAVPSYDQTPGW